MEEQSKASADGVPVDPEEFVTRAEAHLRAEEVVERCMAEAGFEYAKRSYFDQGRGDGMGQLRSDIYLSGSSDSGYGGTFLALSLIAPSGAPVGLASRAEVAEYDRAYLGDASHVHDDGELPHANGEQGEHVHPDVGGAPGCKTLGEQALSAQNIRQGDEFDAQMAELGNQAFSKILATPEFGEFVAAWAECFTSSGYAVAGGRARSEGFVGSDITAHTIESQLLFAGNVSELFRTLEVSAAELAANLPSTLDQEWLQQVVAQAPPIDQVFQQEVQQATADSRCRTANSHLIDDTIEEIAAQVGLTP